MFACSALLFVFHDFLPQTLNISFNPLQRPPTALCALTSLQTLTYHGCPWVSFIWPPKANVP